MHATCPCGNRLRIGTHMLGCTVRCPVCQGTLDLADEVPQTGVVAALHPDTEPPLLEVVEAPRRRSRPKQSFLSRHGALIGLSVIVLLGGGIVLSYALSELAAPPPVQQIAYTRPSPMTPVNARVHVSKSRPVERAPNDLQFLTNVSALVYSPDSTKLATVQSLRDRDHFYCLQLWDVATGRQLFNLQAGNDRLTRPVFSPDGKRLSCLCEADKQVRVWDVSTGLEERSFNASVGIGFTTELLAFTPDGTALLWVTNGTIMQTNLDDLRTATLPGIKLELGTRLASSPREPIIAIHGKELRIVQQGSGKVLQRKPAVPNCTALAFSGDGHTLALAYLDGTIELFDPATLAVRRQLKREQFDHFRSYATIELSWNGKKLGGVPEFRNQVGAHSLVEIWNVDDQSRYGRTFPQPWTHFALAPSGDQFGIVPVNGRLQLETLNARFMGNPRER